MYEMSERRTMKKERVIVIRTDDTIETLEIDGNNDAALLNAISDTVGGLFDRFATTTFPCQPCQLEGAFYCNDNGMNDDSLELNALATFYYGGRPIYGDVCVTKVVDSRRGQEGGFDYKETEDGEEDICECWLVEDSLLLTRNRAESTLDLLRALFSRKKDKDGRD